MAETTAEVTQDLDVPTAGNVANSRAWHLAHVPWELRLQLEELQQHGEAQPRRTCLVAHQSGQVFRLPVPPHRHPSQLGDLCMEQVRPYRPGHPLLQAVSKDHAELLWGWGPASGAPGLDRRGGRRIR